MRECESIVNGVNDTEPRADELEQREFLLTIDAHSAQSRWFAAMFATKGWRHLLRPYRKWHIERDRLGSRPLLLMLLLVSTT
jgi:hypothetical protein